MIAHREAGTLTIRQAARSGSVLLSAIAALVFIEIIAIGLIALAGRASLSTTEYASRTTARIAAESAVRRATALWDERAVGFPGTGSRFTVPWATGRLPDGTRFAVTAERLRRGQLLLRGSAWSAAGVSGARAEALLTVSAIPADAIRLDFHSAIVAGGDITLLDGAVVDGTTPDSPPSPLQTADCTDPGPAPPVPSGSPRPGLALATGAILTAAPTASIIGAPGLLSAAPGASPAAFSRLGRIPLTDLPAIADRIETGAVSLGSRTSGAVCDTTAAGNWGAPDNRADPCFDRFQLVFAPGDLTITGGEGQGILVVAGNLVIADGVRFLGAILATGQLDAGAARIDGAVRVGAAGSRIGAAVHFDECALTRALTLSPAMRKVYRVSDRWWLPPW